MMSDKQLSFNKTMDELGSIETPSDMLSDEEQSVVRNCKCGDSSHWLCFKDSLKGSSSCVLNGGDRCSTASSFDYSSIWIIFHKETSELLDPEDIEVLLPQNSCSSVLSKTFKVTMHLSNSLLDHYSKEIKEFKSQDEYFKDVKNTIIAQVNCLPNECTATLYEIPNHHYQIWLSKRNICSDVLLSKSYEQEIYIQLQHVKSVLIESEENIQENLLKHIISSDDESLSCSIDLGTAISDYMSKSESAAQLLHKSEVAFLSQRINELTRDIKESQSSVSSLVHYNNLLLSENTKLANKYGQIKMELIQGDGKSEEELGKVTKKEEYYLIVSNERLRVRLSEMLKTMEELQNRLSLLEDNNLSLEETLIKLRVEQEQQTFRHRQCLNAHSLKKAKLRKEIFRRDHAIEQAIGIGKILYNNIKAIGNELNCLGCDVCSEKYTENENNPEDLSRLLTACNNCISEINRFILATHNKAETLDRRLMRRLVQISDEKLTMSKEIEELNVKLFHANNEKLSFENNVTELKNDNSVIQELLSENEISNIPIENEMYKLQKKQFDQKTEPGEKNVNNSETDVSKESCEETRSEIKKLQTENHRLLVKICEAETKIKMLEVKEKMLSKAKDNHNARVATTKESDSRVAVLNETRENLTTDTEKLQKENFQLREQVEMLNKANSFFRNSQLEQSNDLTKANHDIKLLQEAVESLSSLLHDEKIKNNELRLEIDAVSKHQGQFNREINFDSKVWRAIELEFNESVIIELESCVSQTEEKFSRLQLEGNSDIHQIEKYKEEAVKWKKQLIYLKKLLKEYQEIRDQITETQTKLIKYFNKPLQKKHFKCDIITREIYEKTQRVLELEHELKKVEGLYSKYRDQAHADLREYENELGITKKRLLEYENHVAVLGKELERQTKKVDELLSKVKPNQKKLEEELLESIKEVYNLKEQLKCTIESNNKAELTIQELTKKYQIIEKCLLEKDNTILSLENDNKILEKVTETCNKISSDLNEQLRKVSQLDSEKIELENHLKEKDEFIKNLLVEIQTVKSELDDLKSIYQKSLQECFQLKSELASQQRESEYSLKKYMDDKNAIEKSYEELTKEKESLKKEHDALCEELVNAIHLLMDNKLELDKLKTQTKEQEENIVKLKEESYQIKQNEITTEAGVPANITNDIQHSSDNLSTHTRPTSGVAKKRVPAKLAGVEFRATWNRKFHSLQKSLISLDEKCKKEKSVYLNSIQTKDKLLKEKEKYLKASCEHNEGLKVILAKTCNQLISQKQLCENLQQNILKAEYEKQLLKLQIQELEGKLKNSMIKEIKSI